MCSKSDRRISHLTLCIGSSDNVDELCSGLPLLNPRRVIVNDVGEPKKSKKIPDLLGTLVRVIPKWDNWCALLKSSHSSGLSSMIMRQTFEFPYAGGYDRVRDPIIDPRAQTLAKSPSSGAIVRCENIA